MHPSSRCNFELFRDVHLSKLNPKAIVEIGSRDFNGSIKPLLPDGMGHIGVDLAAGKGVDVVLDNPLVLPFADSSQECVIASSVLEHSEFFWVLFSEFIRVLKPGGLLYLNVPSNGRIHRFPIDAWRFYPDSGPSLVSWANRNGHAGVLIESYISPKDQGSTPDSQWNDWVGVFSKEGDVKTGKYQSSYMHSKLSNVFGVRIGIGDLDYPLFEEHEDILTIGRLKKNRAQMESRIAELKEDARKREEQVKVDRAQMESRIAELKEEIQLRKTFSARLFKWD